MKLSTWAKKQGIHYQTAWKWFNEGKLPVKATQLPTGTILVEECDTETPKHERVVTYSRVSNHSRREELIYQVDRCVKFCNENGWSVSKSYKEVASGMNDSRKVLWDMLDSKPTKIVVENKDRLTRFGFEFIARLVPNCEVVIMNDSETDEEDLIKDLTSVIYSFCARMYGMRRAKNKAEQCKEIISK